MIFACCTENRRAAVVGKAGLNGIDYLEVLDSEVPPGVPRQQMLLLHCLNPLAAGQSFGTTNVLITGGESITQIGIVAVVPASEITAASQPAPIAALLPFVTNLADRPNVLVVLTSQPGDFSPYQLRLVNSAEQAAKDAFAITGVLTGFDPQLAQVSFSFKIECGPDFDCQPATPDCPTSVVAPPINYLAKDYGSFRTIMLDRMNQLLPSWGATSEADLGIALAELIAYVGDRLSYQQDAVATEAYLATARRRVSLRRHAFLVDYPVSDGCNARAWMQLQVNTNPGVPVFLERAGTRFYTTVPGTTVDLSTTAGAQAALLNGVQVFEPMHDAVLYAEHSEMRFYTWGETNCCLPAGATEATLLGSYPLLLAGEVLVFQEVKGPLTGDPADADLRHRYAVRLTAATVVNDQGQTLQDPLFTDANGQPILVTEIQWAAADALPAPLCISSSFIDSDGDTQTVSDVSVAFGNVVLADHGLSFTDQPLPTVPQPFLFYPPDPAADRCNPTAATPVPVRYNPAAPEANLTQVVPLAMVPLPAAGNPVTTGVVRFTGAGQIVLYGSPPPSSGLSQGFATLTLAATNPAGWPGNFGVRVSANTANPGEIDLQLVYSAPAGAAVIPPALVPLEVFTGLSFDPAAVNYVVTGINGSSQLIEIPAGYIPPTGTLATLPATPFMLSATAAVTLADGAGTPFLTVQPKYPAAWPVLFGVSAAPDPQAGFFDLSVVYDPAVAIGVTLPVPVEAFETLSLENAAAAIAPSALITVTSLAQAPDSTLSATAIMTYNAKDAVPSVTLSGTLANTTTTWNPVADLLESGETDPVFVVETEFDDSARFRFGDNTNGRFPESGTSFTASYRIGNGTAGNVGAESLTNLAGADPRVQCRNPLPAAGGTDPETGDQIRRRAPQAFLTQQRAVTVADWQALAQQNAAVARAAAALRWTGSWYTADVAVEPVGGGALTSSQATSLRQYLEPFRVAGQDLELNSPDYVSLEIALTVCVDPSYFQAVVEKALLLVLSNKMLANGQTGVFYPANFGFGQTVYLSPVYAAARGVAGVVLVSATTFQPQGVNTTRYLAAGEIPLGPMQIARLDNDPNYPAHGQLTLNMQGGK
jgi:hypothetical protein